MSALSYALSVLSATSAQLYIPLTYRGIKKRKTTAALVHDPNTSLVRQQHAASHDALPFAAHRTTMKAWRRFLNAYCRIDPPLDGRTDPSPSYRQPCVTEFLPAPTVTHFIISVPNAYAFRPRGRAQCNCQQEIPT